MYCSEHLRSNKICLFPCLRRYQLVSWVKWRELCMRKSCTLLPLPSKWPLAFFKTYLSSNVLHWKLSPIQRIVSFHHIPFWKIWGWLPFLNQIPSVVLCLCTQGHDPMYMSNRTPRSRIFSQWFSTNPVPWTPCCDMAGFHRFVQTVSTLLFICLIQPTSRSYSCFYFYQWMEDQQVPRWFHHVGYFKLSQLMAVIKQSQ